jgi:hypothetical protein
MSWIRQAAAYNGQCQSTGCRISKGEAKQTPDDENQRGQQGPLDAALHLWLPVIQLIDTHRL